jgi:hypothetical protein
MSWTASNVERCRKALQYLAAVVLAVALAVAWQLLRLRACDIERHIS